MASPVAGRRNPLRAAGILVSVALLTGLVAVGTPSPVRSAEPACDFGAAEPYGTGLKVTCVYDAAPPPADNGNAGNPDGHLLDVFWPADKSGTELASLPVVFWIHGGGLITGSKEGFHSEAIINHFLDTDHVVVAINYTLRDSACGEGSLACNPIDPDDGDGDTFEAELQWLRDSANAFRWTYENVTGAGLGDPGRITLVGHSAGAHIATLLATEKDHLAAAFGIEPEQADVRAVVAGVIALGFPPNLNTVDDTAEWPLARQDFEINSADINALFDHIYDSDADMAAQGRPGTQMWQWASAQWQAMEKETTQIPPFLLGAGGGDCSATNGDPRWCRTTNWAGDFPDPVAFAATQRDFTAWAHGEGVHASFVQPLISVADTEQAGAHRCWGHLAHSNLLDLFAPEQGRLNWDMTYYEEAPGVCNVLAERKARAANDAFLATLDAFVDTQVALDPQPIDWQPSSLAPDVAAFSAASIADEAADPRRINIAGPARDGWSSARPAGDAPAPWDAGAGEPAAAVVTQGTRTILTADFAAAGTAPESIFRMQASGVDDVLAISAPVADGTYDVAGVVADTEAGCRRADVFQEDAVSPTETGVLLAGPAATQAAAVDLGTATVTDGRLDVRLVATDGSCAPPRLAGIELTPADAGPAWAVDVSLRGGIRYANSATPIDADFERRVDGNKLESISGTAELPGTAGGTAYVSVSANRFWVFDFYTGRIRVVDPGAGINTTTPVFGSVANSDDTTTVRAKWFTFEPPFSLRTYSAAVSVTEH